MRQSTSMVPEAPLESTEHGLVPQGDVEGQERPLRRWDFVHCPPDTNHMIVAAGERPCVVIAVGAREHAATGDWGAYRVEEAARRRRERRARDARRARGVRALSRSAASRLSRRFAARRLMRPQPRAPLAVGLMY